MKRIPLLSCAALATVLVLGGCQTSSSSDTTASPPAAATTAGLASTKWQLVGFQSMDDAQGTTKPGEGRVYTLEFGADGALAMQLDCNRGRTSWTTRDSGPEGGTLVIGPIATTRAMCEQPDIGQMMSARLSEVASYTLRNGHLFLALKMDSGIFEFAPLQP
ncbi:heat shock protein HslJ [Novosphingobium sp. PhB165]|uniref:META domain-containing protein n=1 Tax=Novosphingobium sp. PhB165 TaxID=2485105 RepID=UPI0010ED942F|nr:META domain-containing protein [Novosphingobium sp. PhB165]TCM17115.1 heat shock protein HslJ [Novosphingobium sp. PhB165]